MGSATTLRDRNNGPEIKNIKLLGYFTMEYICSEGIELFSGTYVVSEVN